MSRDVSRLCGMTKRWTRVLSMAFVLTGLTGGPARAQNPPRPTLTQVTITKPQGTPQNPFRTNRDIVGIEFSSDAANGIFFAKSEGGDVSMTTFLANTSSGKLGAGLLKDGPHEISVLVSTAANVPTTQQITITSKTVTVVRDTTPPLLTITQIKLRPNGFFEGFDPARQYRTNANQITLRGVVNDGPSGVPPTDISITSAGTIEPASAKPDASGQWELTVSIAKEPDGPIDLRVVANDNVGDTPRDGNRVEVPVGLR